MTGEDLPDRAQVTDTISASLLREVLHQIVRRAQVMGLCEIQVPSMPKDPVRLVEKAHDDYVTRFSDADEVCTVQGAPHIDTSLGQEKETQSTPQDNNAMFLLPCRCRRQRVSLTCCEHAW